MATDLTKMVEEWYGDIRKKNEIGNSLYDALKAMAAEIEANREEIEKLKTQDVNPYLLTKEELEQIRDFTGRR